LGRVSVSLREEEHPVFLPSYRGEVGVTKAASRFNECLQHRLEIEGRAADDLEHVGSSSLLPERLAQLFRARLHLVEQPHVLARDYRLVGEGSDELNLLGSEWAHRISSQRDGPNRHSFPQEWDSKKRAKAARLQGSRIRVFRIDQNVGNMDDFAIKQDTPRHRCSVDSSWVTGHELGLFMRQPVTRLEVVSFAP